MINIDYRDARPVYEQVKDEFKNLIFHGVLKPDDKIPAVRELASNLAINPNTIQRAYKELESEGYIYSVKGKGTFVADVPKENTYINKEKILDQFSYLLDELLYLGTSKEELIDLINERNEKND